MRRRDPARCLVRLSSPLASCGDAVGDLSREPRRSEARSLTPSGRCRDAGLGQSLEQDPWEVIEATPFARKIDLPCPGR